jgi:hypothetical protein
MLKKNCCGGLKLTQNGRIVDGNSKMPMADSGNSAQWWKKSRSPRLMLGA